MATFSTKKILHGSISLIPTIANRIQEEFVNEGYEVAMDALSSGGYDISITKGGFFKAILGMKSALKITLIPQGGNINFEAGIGIWGQQVVPTAISVFLFAPVIFTQIWGLINQAKLDDKALTIAKEVIDNSNMDINVTNENKFCTKCGTKNTADAKFCFECGNSL